MFYNSSTCDQSVPVSARNNPIIHLLSILAIKFKSKKHIFSHVFVFRYAFIRITKFREGVLYPMAL